MEVAKEALKAVGKYREQVMTQEGLNAEWKKIPEDHKKVGPGKTIIPPPVLGKDVLHPVTDPHYSLRLYISHQMQRTKEQELEEVEQGVTNEMIEELWETVDEEFKTRGQVTTPCPILGQDIEPNIDYADLPRELQNYISQFWENETQLERMRQAKLRRMQEEQEAQQQQEFQQGAGTSSQRAQGPSTRSREEALKILTGALPTRDRTGVVTPLTEDDTAMEGVRTADRLTQQIQLSDDILTAAMAVQNQPMDTSGPPTTSQQQRGEVLAKDGFGTLMRELTQKAEIIKNLPGGAEQVKIIERTKETIKEGVKRRVQSILGKRQGQHQGPEEANTQGQTRTKCPSLEGMYIGLAHLQAEVEHMHPNNIPIPRASTDPRVDDRVIAYQDLCDWITLMHERIESVRRGLDSELNATSNRQRAADEQIEKMRLMYSDVINSRNAEIQQVTAYKDLEIQSLKMTLKQMTETFAVQMRTQQAGPPPMGQPWGQQLLVTIPGST